MVPIPLHHSLSNLKLFLRKLRMLVYAVLLARMWSMLMEACLIVGNVVGLMTAGLGRVTIKAEVNAERRVGMPMSPAQVVLAMAAVRRRGEVK